MQHTSKYQFKLIEGTDDFSPGPLNDNMEMVEEALAGIEGDLSALETDLAGQIEEVEDSVTALKSSGKLARIAYGTYNGTGTYGAANPVTITTGFAPALVLLYDLTSGSTSTSVETVHFMRGCNTYRPFMSSTTTITWGNANVSWYNDQYAQYQYNTSGSTFLYCILGFDAE